MPKELIFEEPREVGFLERLLFERPGGLIEIALWIGAALSIALAIFHLYVAEFGTPEGRSFRSVHLSVMLILAILIKPLYRPSILSSKGDQDKPHLGSTDSRRAVGLAIDVALIGLILFVQIWTIYDIDSFHLRYGEKRPSDIVVGAILIAIILETTRRIVGWAMVLITGFFIAHALYANYFFGFFYGPPVSPGKFIDTLFMSSDGIFGVPLHVCSTYIVLFIIFGAVLRSSGAGRFFIDLAVALTGHRQGGPAKAATVASGFMGTVSGSAVANVVTTGSFTIPLMKSVGYRARFAAAVEACASSGGQITPPIMGAAAFIMAEFLRTSYLSIILAALIPAFLYFATIYFMVHLEAAKHGVGRIPKEELPNAIDVFRRGGHLLLAVAVLMGFLIVGYTPMKAALWSLLAVVALSFVRPATRMSPVDLLAALEAGIRATVPVTIACACAGLIIGSVFVSGLGLKFTQSVIDLSGGYLFVLLLLTGVAAIILGMGITTTAVYITVAALIVPALEKTGIEPIAAHMFAFYFGVVSTITPPVALASFAAAAIAKTPPMATAFESTRVGIAKYLVPLAFVYNPALLFVGPVWLTVLSTILAVIGLWVLSTGLEGWYRGRITWPLRLLLIVSAVAILLPSNVTILGISTILPIGAGLVLSAMILIPRLAANPATAVPGAPRG